MADSPQGRGVNAGVGTSSTGQKQTTQAQAHKALQQVQAAVQQSQQQIAPPRRHHPHTVTQPGASSSTTQTQTFSQVKESTTVQQQQQHASSQQQVQGAPAVSHSFCLYTFFLCVFYSVK